MTKTFEISDLTSAVHNYSNCKVQADAAQDALRSAERCLEQAQQKYDACKNNLKAADAKVRSIVS